MQYTRRKDQGNFCAGLPGLPKTGRKVVKDEISGAMGIPPYPRCLQARLSRLIGDGVGDARGREALAAQAAGGAPAAGAALILVA